MEMNYRLHPGCKHVVSPDEVETHRDFLLKKINIPTNGKVLAKRSAKLFPHLRFAEQASNQLEKIKDPGCCTTSLLEIIGFGKSGS